MEISEHLDAKDSRSRTIFMFYTFVFHWTSHMQGCIKPLLYGHQLGMETGEVEIAMYHLAIYVEVLMCTGTRPLGEVISELESNRKLMREYKQEAIRSYQALALQFLLNMVRPCKDPTLLTGDAMNEVEVRNVAKEKGSVLLELEADFYCLQLAYYFGDYEKAASHSRLTKDFGTKQGPGHVLVTRNAMFRGLTHLALAGQGKQHRQNLAIAGEITKRMRKWVSSGNVNCLHMLRLVEAETAAVKKLSSAVQLYEDAISTANKSSYLQDKALAHERAALFHMYGLGDWYWAGHHFGRAVVAYSDWGAFEKVRQLLSKYDGALELSAHSQSLLETSESHNDDARGFLGHTHL